MVISSGNLIILFGCLSVIDQVFSGRKNELNLSKGDPSPLVFWPIQTSKHNRTNTEGKMLAILHDVDLVTGPTTNAGTLDALSFRGIPNSYVKIENVNGILNGDNAMNWMFYMYYSETTVTATLLEYCNPTGAPSGFSLSIRNGSLKASFLDQNDVVYNPQSSFILPVSTWNFVGINFNKLWSDDQFDLFMIDTDKNLISETFGLGTSTLLQIHALGSVVLGSNQWGNDNFQGKIACIQFSNKSQIKTPQEDAPRLCDPNLWVDPEYGELTKDAVITTVPPTMTTTTTPATTTSAVTTTTNEITMPVSTTSYPNTSVTVCEDNNTVIICHCFTTFTNDQLYRRLHWLRDLLRVDKKTTSAALRLRTSASDDRISVKAIGGFGVSILIILIMGIILPDIIDLVSFVYKSRGKKCIL